MNILPLIIALLLILSAVTIQKFEEFKNSMIVQEQYSKAIEEQDRKVYNRRQQALIGKNDKVNYRKLSFRPFLEKKMREPDYQEKYQQYRQITVDLIQILYGHTLFYKEAEQQRANLAEELIEAIQESADEMPDGEIKRIQDISKIQLKDPLLRDVFYRMLKGTIEKDEHKELIANNQQTSLSLNKEKIYYSLLTFVNYDGARNQGGKVNPNYSHCKIELGLAPKELLLAIFGDPQLVDAMIRRRIELTQKKIAGNSEGSDQFKTEFQGKQKPGIKDDLLDFTISSTPKANRD